MEAPALQAPALTSEEMAESWMSKLDTVMTITQTMVMAEVILAKSRQAGVEPLVTLTQKVSVRTLVGMESLSTQQLGSEMTATPIMMMGVAQPAK